MAIKLNKKENKIYSQIFGPVAQLVEHYLDMVVVDGSSPFGATIFISNSPKHKKLKNKI